MIPTVGAMLRISLRRTRADWPIVAAAAIICLLATTLLAASSMFASAVSLAGLQRVLADAPVAGAIGVSTWVSTTDVDAVDTTVGAALDRTFGPARGAIDRIELSDSFALPDRSTSDLTELALLGTADGLARHSTILAGAWPADVPADGDTVPVAVSRQVADALGLDIGTRFVLASSGGPGRTVPVEISGIFRIDDPTAPFWWADGQLLDGVSTSGSFVTRGPFFTTEGALRANAPRDAIQLVWHASPDIAALAMTDVSGLAVRAGDLRHQLDATLTDHANVTTDLPDILARTERSLVVSQTGVVLLTIQVVVLAVYAVLLSAAMLIEHRQAGNALLRSRGASPNRLFALALIEGLLIAVPAALLGPWLARVALRAFEVSGPLVTVGLTIDPRVTLDAYAGAGAAAAVCLVALTVPTLIAARSVGSAEARVSRAPTTGMGRRLGLDVALVVIAAIGLWQLRLYGAPLTESVHGTLGIDPLLVATPAIGLLAGALVALRLVPSLARILERATTGGRGLVPSLGARQLARRPLRYTRAAMLLMLAMAIGVFAISYTWTWTTSQRDQAVFQVGADLRVRPSTQLAAIPDWGLARAYAGLAGVSARMPVERVSIGGSRTTGSGALLALDAAAASSVADLRADLSPGPLDSLMAPLVAARPTFGGLTLPGEPTQIRLDADVAMRRLERSEADPATGVDKAVPARLAEVRAWRGFRASVVVRDADGLMHRFESDATALDGGRQSVVISLGGPAGVAASFAYPLDIVSIGLSISLPERYQATDATVTVTGLATPDGGAGWTDVPLGLTSGWRSTAAYYGRPEEVVDQAILGSDLSATVGSPGFKVLAGVDKFGGATELRFVPSDLGSIAGLVIPILASDTFLQATSSAVGDRTEITIDGVQREVLISDSVRAFPTTDPSDPVAIMDLATLTAIRLEGTSAVRPPDEWWLSVADADADGIAARLSARPFVSRAVSTEVGRGRTLATDPVALGIIGALAIGFVAATLFAMIGFIVSASVSARERIGEFALLRALGLSSAQLSAWLSLENTVLASVSLVSGVALGLLMAWIVLPFITVTQDAVAPYPPVVVDVPWDVVGVLVAAAVLALGTTVVVLAWLLPRTSMGSALRADDD